MEINKPIKSANDLMFLFQELATRKTEYKYVVGLKDNEVLYIKDYTLKSNRCSVESDYSKIFKDAFLSGAEELMFVHNHPDCYAIRPSEQDIKIHFDLRKVFRYTGLHLYDDAIVGKRGYFLMSDYYTFLYDMTYDRKPHKIFNAIANEINDKGGLHDW